MSVTTRSPLRMGGANFFSGGVNTGELQQVRGGNVAATFGSGMVVPNLAGAPGSVAGGSDVLIFSGAGRLNSFVQHTQLASGQPVFFYDSAIMTSGGPFIASGHKILGLVPSTFQGGAWSGLGIIPWNGQHVNIDVPFQSGLAFNSRSGQPGFTVTWTPEINPAIG